MINTGDIIKYPSDVGFTKTWRPYQQRVLSGMDLHLDDNHLHIVAAPGSGKTVLGLEAVIRLNKPALILAPTLTIRDQWIQRFVELFLPEGSATPDWITTDIRSPRFLTITTYQALHSVISGQAGEEDLEAEAEESEENVLSTANETGAAVDVVALLKGAGVKTLVVDEAHHLRAQWWKSLTDVKGKLDNPLVVALTATPPYDVSQFEWERYRVLCGPVDAEVSVPELVLDGNLCPHQDYVYFNHPSREEKERIGEFYREVESLRRDICSNEEFVSALESHPWLTYPEKHLEEILSNPEYFSSIAVFMNAVHGRVPEKLLEAMGVSEKKLPPLDLDWLEVLLINRLYKDEANGPEIDPVLKEIRERLSRIGAVDRRQVYLRTTPGLDKLLISSIKKLDSILSIVKLESGSMSSNLRMVILTDFIRKSEMPHGSQDIKPLNRLGVVPIFEKIRRECPDEIKLGVLSGSLVIVPKSSEKMLRIICAEEGIAPEQVSLCPIEHDSNFLSLDLLHEENQSKVRIVTRLFSEGGITVLVGTKSLLGEGWDAPCVNSLILASFVGSYMLSNQMRGRAIRALPGCRDKTANIWHLVCVNPYSDNPGADLSTLRRRFKAFVGVSFTEKVIANGIGRLGLGQGNFNSNRIDEINQTMCRMALDRSELRRKWEEALTIKTTPMRLVDSVKSPPNNLPRQLVLTDSVIALFVQSISWAGRIFSNIANNLPHISDKMQGISSWEIASIAFTTSAIITAPYCIKAVYLFIKHGPIEWSVKQICNALLDTLVYIKVIKTERSKLAIVAEKNPDGYLICTLEGATSRELAVFLESLQEILDPIQNPRYIIIRKFFFGTIRGEDYHAVPEIIGSKGEWAEDFRDNWHRYVGPTDLIYTRTIIGRRTLLKARESSLSAVFQPVCERVSCWK